MGAHARRHAFQVAALTSLYSPAIQRARSDAYHLENRRSDGPPGRFVKSMSLSNSVTMRNDGAKLVSRLSLRKTCPWHGVAWPPGSASGPLSKPNHRDIREPPKRMCVKEISCAVFHGFGVTSRAFSATLL